MRWIIIFFIVLILVISFMPVLRKFGLGRLPGDIYFRIGRHEVEIPLMSTLILAAVIMIVAKFI